MKLLVILLCILSERYLVHAISYLRFNWFPTYCNKIFQTLQQSAWLLNPVILMAIFVLPIVLIVALVLAMADHLLFGLIGFLLNLVIFYYCIGPSNPFYPVRSELDNENSELFVGIYFVQANRQLFSLIFWYGITGILGALVYRLITLCREQELTARPAIQITNLMEWIPTRITVFLFLLVGNFQKGILFYKQNFISSPLNNERLLSEGGLLCLRTSENETVQLPSAEKLVEHALIVNLVFLALFTLIAFM
ncbi:MAG: hypothetical protein H0U70_04290 [Tatlockia sp.]|nr:hypothetical protein [Tatlockia sp.]